MRKLTLQQLKDLAEFDEIVDVRSPGEFAEDHLPGAINLPVLNDEERAEVGTQYKHDPFQGRWRGAALISINIARHIQDYFSKHPRGYRPLIYCWRGGLRSQSLTTVLGSVGWQTTLLQGGYKAYRRLVVQQVEEAAKKLNFHVITGLTGAGKSRLLRKMQSMGLQVLDLEKLAAHRGSLLGDEPNQLQPSQKGFETAIWAALQTFSPEKPVWVESESRRVGRLFCPEPLWERMVTAPVTELATARPLRARMLLEDYQHFVTAPETLLAKLEILKASQGAERVQAWNDQIAAGQWPEFVESLLQHHYDPAYAKAGKYPPATATQTLADATDTALENVALALGRV